MHMQENFHGLGLAPGILEILTRLGFKAPTPIQGKAIPAAIEGKDIVGIAQTGTGKTLAFGLPMIQRLQANQGQGLVVVPTRELAIQVDESLRKVGASLGIRTAVLIGGAPMGPQIHLLHKRPNIIVATPGRLIDHLEQRILRLDKVIIAVLDEADRMLDMGFMPQITRIFEALPKERQTMLFSATMPSEIMKMAARHMKLPVRVEIAPAGTTAERVTQELFIVSKDQKMRLLEKLLQTYHGPTLIFSRTKYGAKRIVRNIRAMNVNAAEIHSNRSLSQRREALEGFKSGRYRALVATDIASRGIDVKDIELVINFDLPSTSDDYVHRIGRTARAGAGGHAITFAMPTEERDVRSIERLIRKNLPVSKLPELPPARVVPFEERPERGPWNRPRPSFGRPNRISHGPKGRGQGPRRQFQSRPRNFPSSR